jgi:hypothetical protein
MSSSSKLIAGTAVVAVVAAAGAAFAAMKLSDSAPSTLEPALSAPYGSGIAGSGLGGGRLGGRGFGGGLGPGPTRGFEFFRAASTAVSSYLDLTVATLRAELQKGQTLSQIAKAQGKTAAGLIAIMVAGQKKRIEAAVSNGFLTQAQAQELESHLERHVTDAVNGVRPPFGGRPSAVPGATA